MSGFVLFQGYVTGSSHLSSAIMIVLKHIHLYHQKVQNILMTTTNKERPCDRDKWTTIHLLEIMF